MATQAERLPYKITKLAHDMYAGPSQGFSGPELHDLSG